MNTGKNRQPHLDGNLVDFLDGQLCGAPEGPDDGMGVDAFLNQVFALV